MATATQVQIESGVRYRPNVVYGEKWGMALLMDILTPENTCGLGMLFVVSGGWNSSREMTVANLPWFSHVARQTGLTIFMVMHGTQPRFTNTEAVEDVRRAVRFVRHSAAHFNIDPQRIGLFGGSAGGHLSLMVATTCDSSIEPADLQGARIPDPVDRTSARVQAVAAFHPPTDFLNYGAPGVNAVGHDVLGEFRPAFFIGGRQATPEQELELGHLISPIRHVTPAMPPVLLVHGDRDQLVPLQQSEIFKARLAELDIPCELRVIEGAEHGWDGIETDILKTAQWVKERLSR